MSELFHNKHFISVRIISQVYMLQKQMKNITLNDGPSDTIVKNEIHIPYVWNRNGHADADIRISFRIIRQYRAISDIYPTYASMRIAKNIRMAIPSVNSKYFLQNYIFLK